MSTVKVMEEELGRPIEIFERAGLCNDLANMPNVKYEYGFIEMKGGLKAEICAIRQSLCWIIKLIKSFCKSNGITISPISMGLFGMPPQG